MSFSSATFAANTSIISDRAFGIELEIDGNGNTAHMVAGLLNAVGVNCRFAGYTHDTTAHWKVVTDASVRGSNPMELVSPILRGEAGLRQVALVCETLAANNVKVNTSCGFHVHVDARNLTADAVRRVCKSFVKHEADFDSLVPPSRRSSQWCKSNLSALGGDIKTAFAKMDQCTTVAQLQRFVCLNDRYWKLNLMSMLRHGTIEFRQHAGTIEAAKVTAWVALVVGMVENCAAAKSVTLAGKPENRFELLLTNAPAPTKAYFRARRAHFASR